MDEPIGCRPDSPGLAGSFLEHDHTLRHFREEFFTPGLLFRNRRAEWIKGGKQRLDQRAEEVARDLARRPVSTGLTEDQSRALEKMADGFLRSLR